MRKPHAIKSKVLGPGRQRPANRWAAWAQTLYERHSRMPVRSRALALVLAGNRPITLKEVERRYFASANFLSQIRLSIAPVLHCLNREVRSLFTGSTSKEYATLGHSFMHKTIRRDGHSNEMVRTRRDFYAVATPGASAQEIVHELTNDHYSSALVRIFDRFLVNGKPGSTVPRFEALVIRTGGQLIKRIVTERNRLEENVRPGLVTQVHRQNTLAVQHAVSERAISESSLNRNASWAPWTNQSGSPIDIEKLTEQVVRSIDGRIVAHRERIGKVF